MEKYSGGKIIYIPGWGDFSRLHPYFEGLEIWEDDIDFEKKIESEYIIGHSLGCHFALLNWERNKNTKLILINPLLKRRNIICWIFRWICFFVFEGWRNLDAEKIGNMKKPFFLVKKAKKFLNQDYFDILKKVPKERVVVIQGERDFFFCTRKIAKRIEEMNIKIIRIPRMGHAWKEKFLSYIKKEIGS